MIIYSLLKISNSTVFFQLQPWTEHIILEAKTASYFTFGDSILSLVELLQIQHCL